LIELPTHKFLTVKWDDVGNALTKEDLKQLDSLLGKIEDYREKENKNRANEYLVVNTDESYAEEVAFILQQNGHWG